MICYATSLKQIPPKNSNQLFQLDLLKDGIFNAFKFEFIMRSEQLNLIGFESTFRVHDIEKSNDKASNTSTQKRSLKTGSKTQLIGSQSDLLNCYQRMLLF